VKSRIIIMTIALVLIVFLIGCATVKSKVPGTGTGEATAKKAATEGTVEVLEVKMEKTEINNKDASSNLKVTGKAIYHPAKAGAKSFEDYISGHGIVIHFYDVKGMKLPFKVDIGDYGEDNKPENIKPNEPFPFEAETGTAYIGMDNFTKAVSCKAKAW